MIPSLVVMVCWRVCTLLLCNLSEKVFSAILFLESNPLIPHSIDIRTEFSAADVVNAVSALLEQCSSDSQLVNDHVSSVGHYLG